MIEQRSAEWHALRCGKATASRISDAVARTKNLGWGASRANYMAELAAERLTGAQAESYSNAAMRWGVEHEDEARACYEFRYDVQVEAVAFIDHPTIAMSGASPDGLVGADGLLEVKCPNTATHIATLLGGPLPSEYAIQIQWQLACTGRQWVDWCSYDPRMPERLRLFTRRVQRDPHYVNVLESEVTQFLYELDGMVEALRAWQRA